VTDKYDVVINASSGQALSHGPGHLCEMLESGLGERINSFAFASPEKFKDIIECLAENSRTPFLIGGGDGSALAAAEVLLQYDLPFGILPLGTMNLLAQDLGIPNDINEAIESCSGECQTKLIDTGLVNDRIFLCSAIMGIVPETSIQREKVRTNNSIQNWSDLMGTLVQGISGKTPRKLKISHNGDEEEFLSDAIVISNNSYIENPETPNDRVRRASLENGRLGVYIACPQNLAENLRLLFRVWKGNWQEDSSLITFEAEEIDLFIDEDEVTIAIDGEPVTMETPISFKIERRVLPVIIPGIE
jgi:diacylglycerol kinase family enzyme